MELVNVYLEMFKMQVWIGYAILGSKEAQNSNFQPWTSQITNVSCGMYVGRHTYIEPCQSLFKYVKDASTAWIGHLRLD